MAKINIPLEPFAVPTHVVLDMPSTGNRQDGLQPKVHLELNKLDEQTLTELCDDFKRRVFMAAGFEEIKQAQVTVPAVDPWTWRVPS